MLTETEAILLRQTKISYNRRMLLLFTKRYGKISAGISMGGKSGNRRNLALQPFTHSSFEMYKNPKSYNVIGADLIRCYYSIGEDVDKYMCGSYVLEYTEKIIQEEAPNPKMFNLLLNFFQLLEKRTRSPETLVLGYQFKTFQLLGVEPQLKGCCLCGKKCEDRFLSVSDGGLICEDCAKVRTQQNHVDDLLIYRDDFGIIGVVRYFLANPIQKLEGLALSESVADPLKKLARRYAEYHLDATNIKSERLV